MTRESALIILGIAVILAPFLGVPYIFLFWFLPIVGALITLIALSMRMRRSRKPAPVVTESYEAGPPAV